MPTHKHPLNTCTSLHGLLVFKDDQTKTKKAPEMQEIRLKFEPASEKQLKKIAKGMDLSDVSEIPDGYIAGYASTTDLDLHRDIVLAGAFDESIAERGLTGPDGVKLLIGHMSTQLGGTIKRLETIDGKLWIEAQLNLEISYVKDAYLAAKMVGGVNFSVGFRLEDYSFKETAAGFEYMEIAKGDLFEVSVVTFGANPNAQMTFIKSHESFGDFTSLAELEKALVADQFTVKTRNSAAALVACVKRLTLKKEAPAATNKPDFYAQAIELAKSINKNTQPE